MEIVFFHVKYRAFIWKITDFMKEELQKFENFSFVKFTEKYLNLISAIKYTIIAGRRKN